MASQSSSSDDRLAQALARVAELEAELAASQRMAQAATQELQHFVYAASHDLQEPLRAITTYSQLLARMYGKDEQTQEVTAFITDGVARMNGLLQNLLAYSRVNMTPKLTMVNLTSAVHSAVFKLDAAIRDSGAVIRFGELPTIPAHEVQMGQLFEHVLSNAILYRRGAPEIEIRAEEGDLNGEAAQVIRVQDNGLGIETQFLGQVLQPFKRLQGKEYPGNGLGLAICEKIVRAHRGRIWLESDGVSGTCVFVAVPC